MGRAEATAGARLMASLTRRLRRERRPSRQEEKIVNNNRGRKNKNDKRRRRRGEEKRGSDNSRAPQIGDSLEGKSGCVCDMQRAF